MPKSISSIMRIAKYTFTDELYQKSFLVMCVVCALAILLVRSCYQGNFVVNGQELDSATVIRVMSKVIFHTIAAGAMLLTALLSMRVFRRDRDDGMQACILAKPVTRWQYVAGKILGLWTLAMLFMFVLHSIVFFIASVNLHVVMPGYLFASLLCSFNLLFVVVGVLLFSLLMPDFIAFLSILVIGVGSFVADGIFAISRSQMGQAMMQQEGSQSDLSGGKVVYFLWPKISGTQQLASSLIGPDGLQGFTAIYPLINVLVYVVILGALLFRRFRNEDII